LDSCLEKKGAILKALSFDSLLLTFGEFESLFIRTEFFLWRVWCRNSIFDYKLKGSNSILTLDRFY
jgi:hypothetical protein